MASEKHIKRIDDRVFYIYSVAIFLLISLRSIDVGTDTSTYVEFFNDKNFYYHDHPTDLAFENLGRFLRIFGTSDGYFIFITGLISFYGIYFIVIKESKNKSFSLILFTIVGIGAVFLFGHMSAIRQRIALAYYFISMYLFYNNDFDRHNYKKHILALLLYVAAILTHGSCLFTLPFVILLRFVKVHRIVWIVLIFVSYAFAAAEISFVSNILNFVFANIDADRYENYAEISFGAIESKGVFNMNLLPFFLISMVILLFAKKDILKQWVVQFFLLSTLLNNVFFDNLMWHRLILYFSIFSIIAIPNAFHQVKSYYKLFFYLIIIMYFSTKTYNFLSRNEYGEGNIVVPYNSWLFTGN